MLDTLNSVLLSAIKNYETKQAVVITFAILMLVACVSIIVVIMMQKGTNDNVGVISGASDTFYGKNKEKTKEGILKKITFALFAFVIVCAIICFAIGQAPVATGA